MSVVGLGCNNFGGRLDADATARVVREALDAGINFLDTADIYGGTKSEEFLGLALKGRRHEAVIATKFFPFPGRSSPRRLMHGLDESVALLEGEPVAIHG